MYFRSCLYDDIVLFCISTIEPSEYWPQSELVSSQWVNDHLQDSSVIIVEVIYDSRNRIIQNAVPGAFVLDWNEDIDQTDYEDTDKQNEKYNKLLKKIGIKDEKTTIMLYSDFNNWFAAIVFWIFKLSGHDNVRLLEGGRREWLHTI